MSSRVVILFALAAALVGFVASDPFFTLLEDEVSIVAAARQPVKQTLSLFIGGEGQHEHPPASDILLHFWLRVAGSSPTLLRLPSMVLFLGGLLFLSEAARLLAGPRAAWILVLLGWLWPFGFHTGRLVGWYSFCFLLVALLTWTYLRYQQTPNSLRLAAFLLVGVLLIYSNYYGWAIIACLLLDSIHRRGSKARPFILGSLTVLTLAYAPLWRAFFHELLAPGAPAGSQPIVSHALNVAAKIQSLFVSDSVAPWHWLLSLAVWGAIFVSMILVIRVLTGQSCAFLLYFGLLFGGMAVLGIIGTRRLLFVAGWLLLPYAVALAQSTGRSRWALALCLLVMGGIGWFGTATRQFYAAQDFLDPWPDVARRSADFIRHGGVLLTNSPVLLFYLPADLADGNRQVALVSHWQDIAASQPSNVLFAIGVNRPLVNETEAVEKDLRANCSLVSAENLLPDSGYSLKARWFPLYGQRPYRIQLERFACAN